MEELSSVCRNPWCKVRFSYTENEMISIKKDPRDKLNETEEEKIAPRECPKCRSFNSEVSGGVEWKDKTYEGSRDDGRPHQIKYKVTNFRL